MILPASYSIVAYRNGDYREQFTMTDGDTPFDITGWTARMQVRVSPGAADPAQIDINTATPTSNGSVITLVTPASGIFEIYIAELDWDGIPVSAVPSTDATSTYDVVFVESGGDRHPYFNGSFTLKEGVTR